MFSPYKLLLDVGLQQENGFSDILLKLVSTEIPKELSMFLTVEQSLYQREGAFEMNLVATS